MSNSKLVSYTRLTDHCTKPRRGTIKGVAIHCMAAPLSVENCGAVFQSRAASSHYGIGPDGRIGQYVDEANRAWCTSDPIDHQLVTIEVACEKDAPYRVTDRAYRALLDLLEDICRRNGLTLRWLAKKALMGDWARQNMVVHRWTSNKACPGDWLYSRHGKIAAAVNARLAQKVEEDDDMTQEKFEEMYTTMMAKTHGDNPSNWAKEATDKAKEKGMFKGDGHDNYDWQEPLTRESAAVIADNMGLLDK